MDLPTDHDVTMAALEGERQAVLALSRAYARLAYLRVVGQAVRCGVGQEGRAPHLWGQHWNEPLRWNRQAEAAGVRRLVFCASMSDVFEDHPELPPERE